MSEPKSAAYAIGVDIGATRTKAVAVTLAGQLLDARSIATGADEQAWKGSVAGLVTDFEAARGTAACIGISSPGLARRDHRAIACMPSRLPGIEGYDWTAALGRGKTVPVLNDAHAALLGEAWLGAARGQRDVVLLTLGTGVGGAILSNGRLLEGHIGRAGHLGHISLDPRGPLDIANTPGSLEDLIGDHSVKARSNGGYASTRDLVDACLDGEPLAQDVWYESLNALAAAIASIINVVDPAIVVMGGGIADAGRLLFAELHEFMDRFEWRPTGSAVPIVRAELGEMAGAYGAARFAIDLSGGHERLAPADRNGTQARRLKAVEIDELNDEDQPS